MVMDESYESLATTAERMSTELYAEMSSREANKALRR
jgi:hypothetical protein